MSKKKFCSLRNTSNVARELNHNLSILCNFIRTPDVFLKNVGTQANWSSLVISSFQE